MQLSRPLVIAPGIWLWPQALDRTQQKELLHDVLSAAQHAPFLRPTMPRSGKPFSVEQTNLGSLGWVSDRSGYRYQKSNPASGAQWPAIPARLLAVWQAALPDAPDPQCCLVNFYRAGARMGLHQDRDEAATDVPVLSVSLGDDALFRIGGTTRTAPTRSLKLRSGDMLAFGGIARLAFHGVDRIVPGTSDLLEAGGRLNLTLRRVTHGAHKKDARSGD
ncbi:MAG: alpha-ketoglutarate-dependent dioxygenase AlkB [Alphaproteobacteria bacterium]|nr:alpha-ketoglutarate-dependent dioxygenase AlkB [Alphaproteobacteria bacterium]